MAAAATLGAAHGGAAGTWGVPGTARRLGGPAPTERPSRTRILLLAAASAATPAPATAHATGARGCDAGYFGVIVSDARGDLVTVCVRDDSDVVVGYLGDVVHWAHTPRPKCYYDQFSNEIECDFRTFPPLPPVWQPGRRPRLRPFRSGTGSPPRRVADVDSKALADVIAADLETVVERARTAYLDRIPRLRDVSPATLDAILEATRRTMALFCRYYLDGTLRSEAWRSVRDATVERAGELFSHAEILEIIDIARSVGTQTIDELAVRHPELSHDERTRVVSAMDRYVAELAVQQDRLRRLAQPARLHDMLADLEREGADLQ